MFRTRSPAWVAGLAVIALASGVSSPALSYKWPGTEPSLGAALAAKAIGKQCKGILKDGEISELEAYMAKTIAAQKASGSKIDLDEFARQLLATYMKKYDDKKMCDDGAIEEARDTLSRVRKVMSAG